MFACVARLGEYNGNLRLTGSTALDDAVIISKLKLVSMKTAY